MGSRKNKKTSYNSVELIPSTLIIATRSFEHFQSALLEYWRKYAGQHGLCTYSEAFKMLSDDMRDHGLFVRYSAYDSFKTISTRKRKSKKR